jgi:hypothetical protein
MNLRRSSGLSRYTELRPGKPPARTSELARSSGLARSGFRVRTHAEIRASRPPVTPEEKWARDTVRARAAGVCEGCGHAPAEQYSHRVGRGQLGPWHPANALHLCGDLGGRPGVLGCHLWATRERVMSRSVGWVLYSTDDFLTFPALLHGRGLVLLTADGGYLPVPTEGDAA